MMDVYDYSTQVALPARPHFSFTAKFAQFLHNIQSISADFIHIFAETRICLHLQQCSCDFNDVYYGKLLTFFPSFSNFWRAVSLAEPTNNCVCCRVRGVVAASVTCVHRTLQPCTTTVELCTQLCVSINTHSRKTHLNSLRNFLSLLAVSIQI